VTVECFPEYTHILTDRLVDSWYLYKIEHSLCLLKHLVKIMKGKVTKEQETRIIVKLMAIESENCNVNQKKISESVLIKEILKDH
jgi:hypothetical protein